MMFLLDTDICIYLIKGNDETLRGKIEAHAPFELAISAVSVAELEYGAAKSKRVEQNRIALRNFFSPFEIIPFDDKDAEQFGVVRAALEKQGQPIGPYDLQIASQALAKGYTVVTNNEREFRRVPELKVENWTRG